MPSDKDGVMIILSSPSGAGKTTLVKKLSEKENFEISISHTTREPRLNENQNEDYFFVSDTEFKNTLHNQITFNFKKNLITVSVQCEEKNCMKFTEDSDELINSIK